MNWTLLKTRKSVFLGTAVVAGLILLANMAGWLSPAVDYNTEVKPILNKKCISCHGGVREKGGFSLMTREKALSPTESGKPAIIPGSPGSSELMRRILSTDPEERMPYEHEPLSKAEINTLRRWIKAGAPWGKHWAYIPVQAVKVPKPRRLWGLLPEKEIPWVKSDLDYFIYQKLQQEGLQPSPEASKATLLRRVSLDLAGLPAPDALARQFLKDTSKTAYARLVDSLLASPRFGERWASVWLDLARYADSKGFERDMERNIWRYRDWLIQAFNDDMPYDRFLTEQIAGDLLPNPSDAQYIATAFHRNTPTNDEGGTDNEEYRTAAVIDRVNTTFEALLGTTFACTQCHGHPYEPFEHEDYFRVLAFFNNSRDEDTFDDYPLLRHYTDEDSLRLDSLTSWMRQRVSQRKAAEIATFLKTLQPSVYSIAADQFANSELYDTKWLSMRNNGSCRLKGIELSGRNQLIYRFQSGFDAGVWDIRLDSLKGPLLVSVKVENSKGAWAIVSQDLPETRGRHDLFFTYRNPKIKDSTLVGLRFDWFHFGERIPVLEAPANAAQKASFWHLLRQQPEGTPIVMDNPRDMHRPTQVFERGNWLVKGKVVQPGIPAELGALPAGAPVNRLGFAHWLSSPQNPLTARTMVNRLWEQLFGAGLVETMEDLGSQGALPTHPELLDWLAWRFMHDHHWSVKSLLREIVLSATYRQDSKANPELIRRDPFNRLYARGPRVRLPAEQVRDQALAASGLLSTKMYGRGVMPYQPDGIWRTPYNSEAWNTSEGEDRHRRAVYTFWKRSSPYPSMVTFDGAGRQVCTARRVRTNTPLQALVTLNDTVYVEAARQFARRMQEAGGGKVRDQIAKGYELAFCRPITAAKLEALMTLRRKALEKYAQNPALAASLLGEPPGEGQAERAALVLVANAIFNLDEFVTKS